jgi:hypothetical protein
VEFLFFFIPLLLTLSLHLCYEAFIVFHSVQGSQGFLRQPSQQQLDTVFKTHKDVDVVTFILQHGKEQHADAIGSSGTTNMSRGSATTVDNRSYVKGI